MQNLTCATIGIIAWAISLISIHNSYKNINEIEIKACLKCIADSLGMQK